MLSNFRFARFSFLITPLEKLSLPEYKGSTFRGGFGVAFKKVVCVSKDKVCSDCILKEKCIYSYVFESPLPSHSKILKKYASIPHPFIIEPPLTTKREFGDNDELSFGLTLIGKGIDYLPYFIYTFTELGKIGIGKGRGKYNLDRVESEGSVIYEKAVLLSRYHIKGMDSIKKESERFKGSREVTLEFLTPTRIRYHNRLTSNVEFHILIRNLLRRLYLLSYFHCGEELNLDYKGLIKEAGSVNIKKKEINWYDWERFSKRQDTKMKLGGFIGKVTYEGDIDKFLPFILLGKYVHIGKGASFGLGMYEIREVEKSKDM